MSILDFIKPDVKVIDIGTRGDVTLGNGSLMTGVPE